MTHKGVRVKFKSVSLPFFRDRETFLFEKSNKCFSSFGISEGKKKGKKSVEGQAARVL